MSLLPRALQKIFGQTGGTSEFGQIGSKAAGLPITTKDLETMQSLTQYLQGLSAIVSDQGTSVLPYLEDINSLFFLATSQLAYLMQSGIPEWNDETEYYQNVSFVSYNGKIWKDLYGTPGTPNLNYEPPANPDKWEVIAPVGSFALTDQANIETECSKGPVFTVTLGGNRTLDNPTNKVIGQSYIWVITQDGTGGRGLIFDTDFVFIGHDWVDKRPNAVTVIRGIVINSTQIRCEIDGSGERQYLESDGYFTVTGAPGTWTTDRAALIPYRTPDGIWRLRFNINGTVNSQSRTIFNLTISGVTFKSYASYFQPVCSYNNANVPALSYVSYTTNEIYILHTNSITIRYGVSGDIELDSKPTWAD